MNNKKYWIAVGIVVILAIIVASRVFLANSSATNTTSKNPSSAAGQQTNQPTGQQSSNSVPSLMQSTGQLFSQSQDYQNAYLIFPTLDPNANKALSGFDLKTENLGNNIYRVTLAAKQQNYVTQTFVVSGDQKVYFVERSLGDDSPNEDSNLRDDYGVAVDTQGYILQ